jgi:hypothetical protein
MTKLIQGPAVIEDAPVYHFPDGDPLGGHAVCDGIQLCGIAAHTFDGHTVYSDVPTDRPLPKGWRWAGIDELDEIHRTHPAATPTQLEEIDRLAAEIRGAGWMNAADQ